MCIYIYTHAYAYIQIPIYIYIHAYVYIEYLYIYILKHQCIYICVYSFMYVYIDISTHVYMEVCKLRCTYVQEKANPKQQKWKKTTAKIRLIFRTKIDYFFGAKNNWFFLDWFFQKSREIYWFFSTFLFRLKKSISIDFFQSWSLWVY